MPRKAVDSEVRLRSLNLKTTESLRAQLEDAARTSGRALTHEVERRLEKSFEREVLAGPGAALLQSMQKVMVRVLRASRDYDEISDGTPLENEAKTRRELRSALDFITSVYTTTGEPLPAEFSAEPGGLLSGEWGGGDMGRLHALVFLDEWADDPIRLARARAGEVDFYWTPVPPQRPLGDIMAEKDGGRDRNAPAPARLPDSGPDVAGKPKRSRKASPET